VDLVLTFPDTGAYKGVTSYIEVGGRDHTKYEIYFRLAFSIFEGIVLYYVVPHLGWLNWFRWSLGQKLTLPLLVAAILSNNPFYIVHAYFPRPFFARLELTMAPLFHGLLYFTILVLLGSLLQSSDLLTITQSTPKLAVGAAKVAVDFAVRLKTLLNAASNRPPLTGDGIGWILGAAQWAVDGVFIAGAAFYVLPAVTYAPAGERAKLKAYATTMGVYVAGVAFWLIVGRLLGFGQKSEAAWTTDFVLANATVLALGVMHWPVEAEIVQSYQEKNERTHEAQILEFEEKPPGSVPEDEDEEDEAGEEATDEK
jgi:hypothetical protein